MVSRRELCDHLDWVLRPPMAGRFVDQVEVVIRRAAAGRTGEMVEVDRRLETVAEAVETWRLDGLVERVRKGEDLCPVDPESGLPMEYVIENQAWDVDDDTPF